jgi:predicted PurR-regulated permease PerM
MTVEARPPIQASVPVAPAWRPVIALPLIVLAFAAGLALVWYSAPSLLLLFAGILFASLLDACTRGLGYILPLARPFRFTLIVMAFAAIAAFALAWGIVRLPGQMHALIQVMDTQLTVLEHQLAELDIDLFGPGGRQDLSQFVSDPGRLFGHVQYAVTGAYVVVMNTIVVSCIGLFFAAQPIAYREGALVLMPVAARPRIRMVMDEMGQTMRSWLLSQLFRSALLTVVLGVALTLLGVPGAPLLALLAGAFNFVPYLGALIAAFPVALVAMPLGLSTLAWVMVTYTIIQTIEGFVLAPVIQKGSIKLAPAWTLFAIVILGALFGGMGVALAAPVLAVARIAVLRFYVEDWLRDSQRRS